MHALLESHPLGSDLGPGLQLYGCVYQLLQHPGRAFHGEPGVEGLLGLPGGPGGPPGIGPDQRLDLPRSRLSAEAGQPVRQLGGDAARAALIDAGRPSP